MAESTSATLAGAMVGDVSCKIAWSVEEQRCRVLGLGDAVIDMRKVASGRPGRLR